MRVRRRMPQGRAAPTTKDVRALSALRNLGPASARWLAEAGIRNESDLRALGAVAAYRRVKHMRPREVTLLMLYALEGALRDMPWNALPEGVKARLKRDANR
jgi:DNA transformation protein